MTRPCIRELIKKYATFEHYDVTEAENGMQAVELCRKHSYDLIIMDVMMPDLDGFSACREIRKHSNVPILMLSARGEEYDKLHGFELGIDDYVVKPFSPKELMMRVAAILKRSSSQTDTRETVEIGELKVDFTARRGYPGRSCAGTEPQGVRFAVLSGAQPRHCPNPGEAAFGNLGL